MTYRACLLYIHLTVNKRNKKALETQTQENIYHLWFSRMVVRMDIENVDIGILGYCDRRILFLNLGCWYNPQILVNTVLHGHVRGCGKVIWGKWGYRNISQLGETFLHGIRESLAISTYSISIVIAALIMIYIVLAPSNL